MIEIYTNAAMLARTIKMRMPVLEQATRDEFDDLCNISVAYMRSIAPVHTGRLRNSISVRKQSFIQGTNHIQLRAVVGPDELVHYWMHPEQGTQPSPGAYIKALDRRVKQGIHPGTPAQRYIERTESRVQSMLPMTASKMVSNKTRVWRTTKSPKAQRG